jgi:hypothetical protein
VRDRLVVRVHRFLMRHHLAQKAMYGGLLAAGLYSLFIPPQIVSEALGLGVYLWSGFMIVGGLTSLVGVWVFRWDTMEATGLSLLWGALGVYGVAALIRSGGQPTRVTIGLVFLACACGLYGRFTEIIVSEREERQRVSRGGRPRE